MKKKDLKNIRRNVILYGNIIISILIILNIKDVNSINDLRFNIFIYIISSILLLIDIFILQLKGVK